MAESKYALTYAGESGNATDGFSLPDNLGKPLQDLNVTLALASVDIRLLTQEQIKLWLRIGLQALETLQLNYGMPPDLRC